MKLVPKIIGVGLAACALLLGSNLASADENDRPKPVQATGGLQYPAQLAAMPTSRLETETPGRRLDPHRPGVVGVTNGFGVSGGREATRASGWYCTRDGWVEVRDYPSPTHVWAKQRGVRGR
jgi:hypothetical protein